MPGDPDPTTIPGEAAVPRAAKAARGAVSPAGEGGGTAGAGPGAAPLPAPVEPPPPASLGALLDRVRPEAHETVVSVREILEKIGERSFTAAILVPSLILVSPLSGIPGSPTVFGAIVLLVTVQALLGRDHLWLPGWLMRRTIGAERLRQGLRFLRPPAAWIDRHSRSRWPALTRGPFRVLALAVMALNALTWPALELVPFFTSFGAGAVALVAIGLLLGDGLYVVGGYLTVAAIVAAAAGLLQGLV